LGFSLPLMRGVLRAPEYLLGPQTVESRPTVSDRPKADMLPPSSYDSFRSELA